MRDQVGPAMVQPMRRLGHVTGAALATRCVVEGCPLVGCAIGRPVINGMARSLSHALFVCELLIMVSATPAAHRHSSATNRPAVCAAAISNQCCRTCSEQYGHLLLLHVAGHTSCNQAARPGPGTSTCYTGFARHGK